MLTISSLRSWLRRSGQRASSPGAGWAQLQVEALEARTAPAGLARLGVGSNVNTGHQAGNQSETAIAINPANPKQLFAAANDNAVSQGMYGAVSTDGGATWRSRVVAGGTDGLPVGVTDPSLSWDSFGNLFFTYINSALTDFIVALSTDGGLTFRAAATITTRDQPHVTTGAGEVAIAYNGTANTLQVSSARVTGLGAVGAFSTVTVPNSNNGNFGDIAIGPTGQIVVNFQGRANTGTGPDAIMVSLDATGVGGAFSNPTTATATTVGGFRPIPAQAVRTIDSEGKLAFDRTNGPHKGRLYLVYTDAPTVASNDTNIFLRHSDDNSATWSAPLRVNDDTGTNSQFFSYDAVDQTTGALALSWYDCRNSPTNTKVEVFATVSLDGGASVQRNVQVAAGLSDATVNQNNGNQYGDYMGLDFNNGAFFPCWVDNSTTLPGNTDLPNFDIATAKVTVVVVPPTPPPPVAHIFYPFRYVFDPRTRLFSGNLTLTNVGGGPLVGSVTFVFPQLPRGVVLVNATGHLANGAPTITIPFVALGTNQSVRIPLFFSDPFGVNLSTFFLGFPIGLSVR